MDFASYIKSLRDRAGLTQEQAAEKIGTSVSTIQKWESGQVLPSRELVTGIIRNYNADWREFRDNLFGAIVPLDAVVDAGVRKTVEQNTEFPFYLFPLELGTKLAGLKLDQEHADYLRNKIAYQLGLKNTTPVNEMSPEELMAFECGDRFRCGAAGLPSEYTSKYTLAQLSKLDSDALGAISITGQAASIVLRWIAEETGPFNFAESFERSCMAAATEMEPERYWKHRLIIAHKLCLRDDPEWAMFLLYGFSLLSEIDCNTNKPSGQTTPDSGLSPVASPDFRASMDAAMFDIAGHVRDKDKHVNGNNTFMLGLLNCTDVWIEQDGELVRWDDADLFRTRQNMLDRAWQASFMLRAIQNRICRHKAQDGTTKNLYVRLNERGALLLDTLYQNFGIMDRDVHREDGWRTIADAPWLEP